MVQTLQISTKSTTQFLSNSCLKNGTQKQKFPIRKTRLSSSYTIPSVTVCAQSGRHLHRHLHVSCVDRSFSAAARLPVCRPCSVNLPQKSSSLVKTIAFYINQMRHKNVTNITSLFVTLPGLSMLIGIFHIGKLCF